MPADLPRTIQDAVLVTRKLEQRHPLVDTLCTIPGSKPDWETEVANIHGVYLLRLAIDYGIAANTAATADEGFLHQDYREKLLAARVIPNFESHTKDTRDEDVDPWSFRG
ncbi:hypothetical protein F5Y18DRAFT_443034 [Xylariaceae sp. FL1019]|nr:hypothetical protein F5Y18DRAFT_443034 [Xylariaceae sp. FL1019]